MDTRTYSSREVPANALYNSNEVILQSSVEDVYIDCNFCKYCEQLKRVNEFNKSNVNKCRRCHSEYCRLWKIKNRKEYNAYHRKYRANNPANKIKHALRTRLSKLINGVHLSRTLLMYVGCDFDFFMNWIHYQFTAEMNWNNFGEYWHIDHVLPVKRFDHESLEAIRICWNWRNLRPLEAKENLCKKDEVNFDLYESQLKKAELFLKLLSIERDTP